jgi:hypothetical protein
MLKCLPRNVTKWLNILHIVNNLLCLKLLLNLNISHAVLLSHVFPLLNGSHHSSVIRLLRPIVLLLRHNLPSWSFARGRSLNFFVISAFFVVKV